VGDKETGKLSRLGVRHSDHALVLLGRGTGVGRDRAALPRSICARIGARTPGRRWSLTNQPILP